jgi:hypothetical protein
MIIRMPRAAGETNARWMAQILTTAFRVAEVLQHSYQQFRAILASLACTLGAGFRP